MSYAYKGCRKKRYAKRKQALTAMNALRATHPNDPKLHQLGVYHCGPCRGWHVGHDWKVSA